MKKQRKRRNLKASGGGTTYYNVEILTGKVALLVQYSFFKAVGLPFLRAIVLVAIGEDPLGVARAA